MDPSKSSEDALLKRIEQLENEIRTLKMNTPGVPDEADRSYHDLVEHSPEGVLVLQDGNLVFYNSILKEYVGYTDEELTLTHFTDFIHPDDVDAAVYFYTKKMSGEDVPSAFEFRIASKDGSFIDMEIYVSYSHWNDKPAIFCYFRDITARKKAEDSLRESEEKYLTLLLNSMEGILVIQDEKVKFNNPKALEITGFTEDEIGRLSIFELIHPDDREAVTARYKRIMSGESLLDPLTYRIYRKGDELRWVEGAGVSITWEGKPADLTFITDVTEKKLAQEALISSEEKLRNFFETSRDVLYITSLDGKIVEINKRGEDFSGYSRKELLELNVIDLYKNPADRERVVNMVISNGYVTDYEIEMQRKDGSLVHCLFASTVRKDKEGTITGFQGSIQDVTEKKQLEQQLVQAQKMEALGNLAGGIAHNFNNILVGIMGYSEFLMNKKDENDPDFKAVKTIFESTTRAAEMTRQLLNVARAGEHAARKMQPEYIVKNTLTLIKNIFDKNIVITTHIQKNIKPIIGDQGQLEQCLLNLCINARDAMPEGGEILIEIENRHIEEDYARSHLEAHTGEYVVLTVSDTGVGMTPEVKQRIFEPFFTTKGDRGGTGMGLATLYGTIKNHNGFINVYSEQGIGTTFMLYLPVSKARAKEIPEKGVPETMRGTETILLIDDELHVLNMWGDLLEENGYVVLTAEDGSRGVEIYRERADEVDLVILDYIMPVMGGGAVIERLKEIDDDVKILVASGYSENGQAKGILNGDTAGFIQKPATIKEFLRKVRTIIDTQDT